MVKNKGTTKIIISYHNFKLTDRNQLEKKKDYIEKDEFDKGARLIFNYGHSFGHAYHSGLLV